MHSVQSQLTSICSYEGARFNPKYGRKTRSASGFARRADMFFSVINSFNVWLAASRLMPLWGRLTLSGKSWLVLVRAGSTELLRCDNAGGSNVLSSIGLSDLVGLWLVGFLFLRVFSSSLESRDLARDCLFCFHGGSEGARCSNVPGKASSYSLSSIFFIFGCVGSAGTFTAWAQCTMCLKSDILCAFFSFQV